MPALTLYKPWLQTLEIYQKYYYYYYLKCDDDDDKHHVKYMYPYIIKLIKWLVWTQTGWRMETLIWQRCTKHGADAHMHTHTCKYTSYICTMLKCQLWVPKNIQAEPQARTWHWFHVITRLTSCSKLQRQPSVYTEFVRQVHKSLFCIYSPLEYELMCKINGHKTQQWVTDSTKFRHVQYRPIYFSLKNHHSEEKMQKSLEIPG